MPRAIDSVSVVLTTRKTCGKNANVVKIAAILPIICYPNLLNKLRITSVCLHYSTDSPLDEITSLYQPKDFFGERL